MGSGHPTGGALLLYQLIANNCSVNNTTTLSFISQTDFAAGDFTTRYASLIPGGNYLLAVRNTGLSDKIFALRLEP